MGLGLAEIRLLLEPRWEVEQEQPLEEEVGPNCWQNLHYNHFHGPRIHQSPSWGHQQVNEQEDLVGLVGEPSSRCRRLLAQLLFSRSLDVSPLLGDPAVQIYY